MNETNTIQKNQTKQLIESKNSTYNVKEKKERQKMEVLNGKLIETEKNRQIYR